MNFNISFTDVLLVSPMIALFLASIIPITIKVLKGNTEQSSAAVLGQSLGGLLVALVLMIILWGSPEAIAFDKALVFDGISLWMGSLAVLASAGSLLLMKDNYSTNGSQFSELAFLTLSSINGMLILVSAIDLMVVFIGLETMSLALYLMIAMSNEQRLSKEAAMKYFVLGSFASAIFLYGVAFLFGTVGTTSLSEIIAATEDLIGSSRMFVFGATLVILGFCFKVSIFPFHAWTADVYQGSPTPHASYMATAVKIVSFAAFLRFMLTKSLVGSPNLLDFLQWVAVITMFVGNVAAIMQNNFKRMLAFSSVAHSGYLLVGVITTGITDSENFGASGVVFYLASYAVMTLGAFAVITLLEKNENTLVSIDDFAGLAKRNPWTAFALTLFLLSLAGIPPTVGFFGKFYLFTAAIGEGLLWLAVWGVLNSVVSVYYYLRPIVVMYMKEGDPETEKFHFSTKTAIAISAVLVVFLGLVSGPIFSALEKALS
jgi:NADH-quinone oxidoreductase subunit N